MSKLFEKFALGDLTLANRMVMAPMTRNRADREGVPPTMMRTHYQQRAGAGLIITESVPISAEAIGYPFTPGLFTEAQVAGWLRLTNAVRSAGGRIFAQLQHCGRISHPSMLPDESIPVAPSALQPAGKAVTYAGMQDFVTPRALETAEVADVVAQFKQGAEMAKRAGFDGVEIHGANGYIIDQFLRDRTNRRDDRYGGSPQNRMRLLSEVLDAVSAVWPKSRIGVRLSPENSFNSMSDSNPEAHFGYFAEQLRRQGLAYLHVLEGDMMTKTAALDYKALRSKFVGTYIANNGYDLPRAQKAIESGAADLIAFGMPFLANPDLVRRFKQNLPLNVPDQTALYGGNDAGYNDYPFYSADAVAAA